MNYLQKYLNKIKIIDIKCVILLVLSALLAVVLRCYKKRIWIIAERPNDAEDNGWIFYHWLKKNHPEQPAYFILNKDATNFNPQDHQMIAWGSFRHYIYYQASSVHIRTMFQKPRPSNRVCAYYEKYLKKNILHIYLRHGISTSGVERHHYDVQQVRMFVCGAKPEYDYINQYGGYPEGYVQYTGFARFDDLLEGMRDERFVLIMPTWRRYIDKYNKTDEENEQLFLDSTYYKYFQALLTNKELVDVIVNAGYKVKFCIHAQFRPYVHLFKDVDPRIEMVDDSVTVHDLLMSTSLLITDYSSVFFDVAYMKKPMIFYQFDYEEFRSKHFSEGYFSYKRDGMGPVVETQEELIEAIKSFYDGEKFVNTDFYLQRCDRFFPTHDNHNCERIYQAIKKIQ